MSLDLSKYEKCTPAPWSCGNGPWNGEKQIDIDGPTNFGNTICWVDRDDCDHEESEANARLISDAPQLLVELREAREENERLAGEVEVLKRLCEHKDEYIQALTRKDA